MKNLITGILVGSLLTVIVFYFINSNEQHNQKEALKEILDQVKQNQATSKQTSETINDPASVLTLQSAFTVMMAPGDKLYYYRKNDCSNMKQADLVNIKTILQEEKNQTKAADLMIIIKMAEGTTYKNSIDLLDVITQAGIPAGHFAEVNMSEREKNCLQHYKKD